MSLTHAQKLSLQTHNGIVLCRGKNAAGQLFWLYIEADKEAIERMHRDLDKGATANFLEYGKVIRKGISEHIPDDVKRYIEETYSFRHTN